MDCFENISKTQNKPKNLENELTQLKQSLPKELWFNGTPMYLYQGFWAPKLDSILAFQNHFQAHDTDVFITSSRKTGTTWLKSLVYAICNRQNHPPSESPLLCHNPHELVPQLESTIYTKSEFPDLCKGKCPRLFGTHVPYQALPTSIKVSKCKIIYIFRNPLDTMISSWKFYQNVSDNKTLKPEMLDLYADMFCDGKMPFSPFEDHVSGYWKKSLEIPEKVLFVKYEDLKDGPVTELKRMADFLQCPFTTEEEETGLIDDIVNLCSFEKLKQVSEPNKSAKVYSTIQNDGFYRKGVVGDWVNFMSPSMAERFNTIMAKKFSGSGFMLP
ncbi:hypothetical protein RND81_11G122000 [Saponaria officinalis]|uniref:Sulfotransferase n=1 Tax=Saponaria officinalis TaxID=3572 RepID=A0AAW1HM54_SAPOF